MNGSSAASNNSPASPEALPTPDPATEADDRAALNSSKAKEIIIRPFLGSRYVKDPTIQMRFWRDFCQPIRGKKGALTDNDVLNDYSLQIKWRDYCNIRFRHFLLELEPILRNARAAPALTHRKIASGSASSSASSSSSSSSASSDAIAGSSGSNASSPAFGALPAAGSSLWNKFVFTRNKVGNLPNITDVTSLANYDYKNYNEIAAFIESLSIIEKKYYVIWNAISALFMSFSKDDPNFDGIWHKKIKQLSYAAFADAANAQVANGGAGGAGAGGAGAGGAGAANGMGRADSIRKQFSQRFRLDSLSSRSMSSAFNPNFNFGPGAPGAVAAYGGPSGAAGTGAGSGGAGGMQSAENSRPTTPKEYMQSHATNNDLRIELKQFLMARLSKMGLFETRHDLITAIFDGDLSVQNFDELLDYCLQDISDPSVYCRYKNDGFEYFIMNRLAFAVFIGLFNNELNKNGSMNQFEYLRTFFTFIWDFGVYNVCFPRSLLHVSGAGRNKNNFNDTMAVTFEEPFYIRQFLFWKEHCCFGLRTEEAKQLEVKQRSLSRSQNQLRELSFSGAREVDLVRELSVNSIDSASVGDYDPPFFGSNGMQNGLGGKKKKRRKKKKKRAQEEEEEKSWKIALILNCNYFQQGTLLHSATDSDMFHYCRLLCENGSDLHKQNQSNGQTPYLMAKNIIKLYYDSLMVPTYTTTKARESEANYFTLKNQKAFSNYFMLYLGINVRDRRDIGDSAGTRPVSARGMGQEAGPYDLYFDLDRFDGAKQKRIFSSESGEAAANGGDASLAPPVGAAVASGSNLDPDLQAHNSMKAITNTVLLLLKDKLPISNDILTMCFEYCLQFDRTLMNEFIAVLELTTKECLDNKYISKEMQARNMAYFKQFLLKSQVWMLSSYDEKYDASNSSDDEEDEEEFNNGNKRRARGSFSEDEAKEERELTPLPPNPSDRGKLLRDRIDKDFETKQKSGLLYNFIENSVLNSLKEEKNYIWQCINHEMNTDRESWNDLIAMKNYKIIRELRQDHIKNGLACEKTEQDLWVMQPLVEANTQYDCFKEYNTKNYLTKCLVLAHSVNQQFHKDMERVFNEICGGKVVYRAGLVKSFDACVSKAESEYYNKKFPTVAHITDFVRCTVTFETCQELLNALHQFKLAIETESGGSVKEIVAIRNGFREVDAWKSEDDAHFVDLKLNVVIEDGRDGTCMLGEVVFLTKFLLKSKKIGHSLAEIKKRSELIENVFKMEMVDTSYDLYQEKVHALVINRDIDHLAKELIWNPNIIMSMVDNERRPLLYHILARDDDSRFKMFDLFYATMVFFHSVLLGKQTGSQFMRKYMNYNNCKDVINETKFWSIDTVKMDKNSKKYQIVEKVMKMTYFHGLSQLPITENEKIIFKCVEEDCFNYLSLIFDFPIKNHATIVNGINFEWRPFCKIFLTPHCSDAWLEMLMFNFESVNIDVKINLRDLQTSYNYCIKEKHEKWANKIEAYAERTNQVIDKQNRPKKWQARERAPEKPAEAPRVKNFLNKYSSRIFGK